MDSCVGVIALCSEHGRRKLHRESVCGISPRVVSLKSKKREEGEGPMEVAELKTMIEDLEARVKKIRDWL